MFYTVCPHCGYKLLRAEEGARLEIFCPKCRAKLYIIVRKGIVVVGKFELKDTIVI